MIQNYDFSSRSLVKLQLDFERSQVSRNLSEFDLLLWIKYVILLASIASFFLHLKYYMDIIQLFGKLKIQYSHESPDEEDEKQQKYKERYLKQKTKN